ncbi:MAG: heptosyltransferase [Alphaproteobacteria bacterium]|nr:heptosyltransferase [Alphaproteobacteria bacterium]
MTEPSPTAASARPLLLVPYMWIGDFVRCHSAIRLLQQRWPGRPVDVLTSTLCAPLLDYMPGVRKGIVCDLPRGRLPLGRYLALARRLRAEGYGTALIMLRTWKAALAPFLAGIPERVGFVGEARFGLINDLRWGERRLERMIDCMGTLALPKGAVLPADWPRPELVVPPREVAEWLDRRGLAAAPHPIVALAPGAVGRGKRWPTARYADLARRLAEQGIGIWVLGGPNETPLAREIAAAAGARVQDLTGTDLRDAVIALKAVDAAVTNDSGLMHIAAALGTATVALFGPTSPRLWAPLNPLAAALEPPASQPDAPVRDRRIEDISPARVFDAVRDALAGPGGNR